MGKEVSINNQALANAFLQMAQCYRYLGPEQRFRSIAYAKAAQTLKNLPTDITAYAQNAASLDRLPGIGEGIAERILEYLQTGHISTWEELQHNVPTELLEMMDMRGMGPATLRVLSEQLGVHDRESLEEALQSGRLSALKGFGPIRIGNIRKALQMHQASGHRLRLDEALEIGAGLLKAVRKLPGIERAALAGSLRRQKETIGDIDILAACRPGRQKAAIRAFCHLKPILQTLAAGTTKASVLLGSPAVQADLRIVTPASFGAALIYMTGSREHNIKLRTRARAQHRKINEYGVFSQDGRIRIAGATEASVYRSLGLDYIEPELREDKGELELSAQHQLPTLVTRQDVRGDMQMHSSWSDGATNIATLARQAIRRFPRYEYIVITDHSPSARIAHGIQAADFRKQWKEIDQINTELGRAFVRKGIEVDILPNGRLDLTDKDLKGFEWITASIHTGFLKDNTQRLIEACRHPLVHCIGHPSGRLLMKREAYPVDWPAVFTAAAETGTCLEINGQPDRLDLNDDLARQAIAAGLRLTLSTDAHHPRQLDFMRLAIATARRAGCSKRHILNTGPWEDLSRWKHSKEQKTEH